MPVWREGERGCPGFCRAQIVQLSQMTTCHHLIVEFTAPRGRGVAKGVKGVELHQGVSLRGDNKLSLALMPKMVETLVITNNTIILHIIGKVI